MYKLLLILKYRRRRRIAWVSLIAVMLCTTMVLVVISVMGGWLRMFRESFHGLSGDIVVDGRSLEGFPKYEEMIRRFEQLPEVKAAAPVIRTFGLINIDKQIRKGVEVVGYPADIQEVNGFRDSLYRLGGNVQGILVNNEQAQLLRESGKSARAIYEQVAKDPPAPRPDAEGYSVVTPGGIYTFDDFGNRVTRAYLAKDPVKEDPAAAADVRIRALADADGNFRRDKAGRIMVEAISEASTLRYDLWPDISYLPPENYKGTLDVKSFPGMIVGTGVIGLKKGKDGQIANRTPYQYTVIGDLTVVSVSGEESGLSLDSRAREFFWLIDDSRTKVYLYDSNSIYVPFEVLQRMLEMDGATGDKRTSTIQIALKEGQDPYQIKPKIQQIVNEVLGRERYPIEVMTWEETHATFLGAVEKEKGLVTILFSMISIVAVFLIFCIFYMIVVEKTRDIGIIKSVGATSSGVAGIFLGYGMAIGVVGSLLGVGLGWLVVHNINELHDMLGRFGIVVWNPEVYLFETIPNTISPVETSVIVAVAIVSSVLGALVPALRAAWMHPVEALRWE